MPERVHNQTDLAYAAGLFDGEGSVGVIYRKSHSKKSTMRTFGVTASVSMVDEESIVWLCSTFGGRVDVSNRTKTGRQVYRMQMAGRTAADFLEKILPYLKLKRSRAEVAIKLARMARPRGAEKGRSGMHPMTLEEVEAQEPLAMFIRSENQRSNPKISGYATWGVN